MWEGNDAGKFQAKRLVELMAVPQSVSIHHQLDGFGAFLLAASSWIRASRSLCGSALPFSQRLTVVKETPNALANSTCENPSPTRILLISLAFNIRSVAQLEIMSIRYMSDAIPHIPQVPRGSF
jgi:hypothetical protein